MAGFNINTTVSQQEAETLKDLIFKRAQERSAKLAEEAQKSYTGSVQSDIMDTARSSFERTQNPFSNIAKKDDAKEAKTETNTEEIGFAKRSVKDIQNQITNKNQSVNKELSDIEVEKAMQNARMDYKKSSSFIGALEFLNSQATISLIKSKGNSFDAIA